VTGVGEQDAVPADLLVGHGSRHRPDAAFIELAGQYPRQRETSGSDTVARGYDNAGPG